MTIWIAILIFLYGMVFTSFFEVVASRLPKHESLNGRSHCDHCHHTLRYRDILPILGYMLNKGKCHFCKKPIPWYHPWVELGGGLVFLIAYAYYGLSLNFWVSIILICVLMIESFSDIHYRIVIDRIWMIGIIPLIIIRIIQGDILTYVLSSVVMFLGLYLLAFIAETLLKKEALGGGDIKLYAFIGLLLPLPLAFFSLCIASLLGLLFLIVKRNRKDPYLPLVPFIFAGVLIAFFYGDMMIKSYLTWIGM